MPIAKEMVALQPDVIFVHSTGFVAAVARETRTTPIVFVNVSDPVGSGFVSKLATAGRQPDRPLLLKSRALPASGSRCSRRFLRASNGLRS